MSAKALLSASVSAPPAVYVEDVFSTFLYTGTGAAQTITNGIDLDGEGGLVWFKARTSTAAGALIDTERGGTSRLVPSLTNAANTSSYITSFNADGFHASASSSTGSTGVNYASWTFRKTEKFFDVVTFTVTDGTLSNRRISHSLNSIPGFIVIKPVSTTGAWVTYHRSNGRGSFQTLNTTNGQNPLANTWGTSDPTATDFGFNENYLGEVGATYVAYLFAHDAGGFGDAGTDSVVKCGSYTGTGAAGNRIELGWEPQFILYKAVSTTGDWGIHDSMRGLGVGTSATSGSGNRLKPNTSDAESGSSNFANIDATGFTITASVSDINGSGQTYIYIAIRRGPMKTPTVGTEVFHAKVDRDASSTTVPSYSAPFTVDLAFSRFRTNVQGNYIGSRLQGLRRMATTGTGAESASTDFAFDYQTGWGNIGGASANFISWMFRRAPGFFDVVAYTGTSSATTVSHNLGVVPELMIVKRRDGAGGWFVYSAPSGNTKEVQLHLPAGLSTNSCWNNTSPTSSIFSVGAGGVGTNDAGETYIAYLFATLAGVSKVGSYTGTGTTLSVDCSFTAGARFVLIKRTDSTGDWYVWDTARGIISGNDPYLLLNSTAAEVTGTDYIDPLSSGFQISSTAPAAINASGGSFIFLAIA
jgi:hypothetical protein